MKVTIAEYAGFCFGVERAIHIVNDATKKYQNVITFGPIIHNPQVVQELADSGAFVKDKISDISQDMTAVVRTHGATVEDMQELDKRAAHVIDATCPFVKKVQDAARKMCEKGIPVVVFGEMDHPEVQGIVSYIKGKCFVVSGAEGVADIPFAPVYGVVAQTTQSEGNYEHLIGALRGKCDALEISYTICRATHDRQAATLELAAQADSMIIVGGRNSANTTRLYQLCKDVCNRVYHIETVSELDDLMILGADHVGISAGASTPIGLVYKVKEYILERAK